MVACACSPSYLESWSGRITWAQEAEVAVSYTTILQPGQQSKTLSKKIKIKKKEEKEKDKNDKDGRGSTSLSEEEGAAGESVDE